MLLFWPNQYYPIVVNPTGEILDGHHRYKICKELHIPIKKESKSKY
jgi:hypothetical protein